MAIKAVPRPAMGQFPQMMDPNLRGPNGFSTLVGQPAEPWLPQQMAPQPQAPAAPPQLYGRGGMPSFNQPISPNMALAQGQGLGWPSQAGQIRAPMVQGAFFQSPFNTAPISTNSPEVTAIQQRVQDMIDQKRMAAGLPPLGTSWQQPGTGQQFAPQPMQPNFGALGANPLPRPMAPQPDAGMAKRRREQAAGDAKAKREAEEKAEGKKDNKKEEIPEIQRSTLQKLRDRRDKISRR